MTDEPKRLRGFALLSSEKRKAVAALGGAAVPANKRTFSTRDGLAESAGRKGGTAKRGAASPGSGRRPVKGEG